MIREATENHSFLHQVVQAIIQREDIPLERQCWIVPTRRAGVFLRDALIQCKRETLWAPEIVSIQDFIRKWIPWQYPEPLRLVFELYDVYRDHLENPDHPERFEQFYSWGEMLLKDFDEIDKYLVDAKQLFSNIRDIKEIETQFHLPEENIKSISQFWDTVYSLDDGSPTQLQEQFLKVWDKLYEIYHDYRKRLFNQGIAYEGMAYRQMIEQLESGALTFTYDHLHFIGFNALSLSEERIIAHLLNKQQGSIYWDVDSAYFELEDGPTPFLSTHPAKFIQEYHGKWKQLDSNLVIHHMAHFSKKIHITGVALPTGQAHYISTLLHETLSHTHALRDHALVLADEQLLFPVLYKLPPAVKSLNITMGYPLKETDVYHLLQSLGGLIRNMQYKGEQWEFAFQDILQILSNSFFQAQAPEAANQLRKAIHEKNWLYVDQNQLDSFKLPPSLKALFEVPASAAGCNSYFLTIFDILLEEVQKTGTALDAEYIFQLYTHFNRFRDILLQYGTELSFFGYTRLFREALSKARLPFEGEPLSGLQLMGFLETRVLDFDHLYILGANEGNLPNTQTGNSFIPYPLRKGFGLPTYEERDTIYAYHFFRLLQRAKEAHIIYNTLGKDEGGSGEISRYIEQLRFYVGKGNDSMELIENQITTPVPYLPPKLISITQSESIQQILQRKFALSLNGTSPQAYISATGLTTYLACPLRYYYRYVAGIKEPELIEEQMEAGTFGSILHQTLEHIYKALGETVLSEKKLPSLLHQLDPSLKQAFTQHELDWDSSRGINFLFRDALYDLCKSILEHDVQGEPYQVVYLEEKEKFSTTLEVEGIPLHLNGTFDRVDWLPDSKVIRIIDYKTGRAKIKPGLEMPELFVNADYKEMVQGLFYAWLYKRGFPTASIKMGFYPLREIQQGLQYLQEGAILTDSLLLEFEQQLSAVLHSIFTEDFTQVEDETVCNYCPYKGICMRG